MDKIGVYIKGQYYHLQDEIIECTNTLIKTMGLEVSPFVNYYNTAFETSKFTPFVLKWLSLHIEVVITRLQNEELPELLDTSLNHQIHEWWQSKRGDSVKVRWHRHSELLDGLKCLLLPLAVLVHSLKERGVCLCSHTKRFKVLEEATWGLKRRLLKDGFIIDGKRIKTTDVLFYTDGFPEKGRERAYQEIKSKGYPYANIGKLKVPMLLFGRLFISHIWLPLVFTLRHFGGGKNYMVKGWLRSFHSTAIRWEILLSHYQIGLNLSVNENSLIHIPQTIILNKHGAKSVAYNWGDLTCYHTVGAQYKAFNIYLIWGNAHLRLQEIYVDKVVEVGCWLKQDFSGLRKDKLLEKYEIPMDGHKVIAFYDESFSSDIHFTEDTFLDFWEMMVELVMQTPNIIGVMKPKKIEDIVLKLLSDKGRQRFKEIRKQGDNLGRVYVVNPLEVEASEVIAMADINITMGVATPSTLALLCRRVGLYYDATDNYTQPFSQMYKDELVFNDKEKLYSMVRRIIEGEHNPLDKLDESLLEDYDKFRDEAGLTRFREALCNILEGKG